MEKENEINTKCRKGISLLLVVRSTLSQTSRGCLSLSFGSYRCGKSGKKPISFVSHDIRFKLRDFRISLSQKIHAKDKENYDNNNNNKTSRC